MKSTASALALVLLCWAVQGENPSKNHIPQLTPAQWRKDLHVLATDIAQRHKNAFAYTSREEFEGAVAELDKRIPDSNGYEVMVGMMRILAKIGDGHTRCDDLFN